MRTPGADDASFKQLFTVQPTSPGVHILTQRSEIIKPLEFKIAQVLALHAALPPVLSRPGWKNPIPRTSRTRCSWASTLARISSGVQLPPSRVAAAVAVETPAAAIRVLWQLPATRGIKAQWTVTRSIKKATKISGSMGSSDRLLGAINPLQHLVGPSGMRL